MLVDHRPDTTPTAEEALQSIVETSLKMNNIIQEWLCCQRFVNQK